MCGIAGIVSQSVDLEAIGRMTEALSHRGPDGSGIWSDSLCALGHRRLAIIDLSVRGKQPLCNEDEKVWIVFNGEIYNFHELRADLEHFGHKFSSHTDTEVIVHAYEQWGTGCLTKLRGMFAFAIWDQQRRRLFLARDRVGKKPLYYADNGRCFAFASELQGLLQCPEVKRELDLDAIDSYLSWGYVPGPRTGFKNVSKLLPAHFLVMDVGHDRIETYVERYWDLVYSPKIKITEAEAAEALREKLMEAVRYRLISDVPLGAFLSGGIDSSIVVGLMAKISGARVKTFSIGFDDRDYNELRFARAIAKRWGTDHTELIVKPDELAVLPKLVRHYGEPYADSSAIPTFYVSKITRSGVTVALNGDGGDESFAGYDRYAATRIADKITSLGFASLTATLAKFLPDSLDPKNRMRRAKRFLSVAHEERPVRYGNWVSYFTAAAKRRLYASHFADAVAASEGQRWMEDLWKDVSGLDSVDAAMAVDIKSYLPYDLLAKVDIASMANSLEARSPFLDHIVMEFAAQLPSDLKLRGGQSKFLLKKAFSDLLPTENVKRPKMGFGVPIAKWLRTSSREMLQDTLLSRRASERGYFKRDRVDYLVKEHVSGRADHSFQLWNLLMLELWQQEFVDAYAPSVNNRNEPPNRNEAPALSI